MKFIAFISIIIITNSLRCFGQELALHNTVRFRGLPPIEQKAYQPDYSYGMKHCKALIYGEVYLISAAVITGAGLIWFNSIRNDPNALDFALPSLFIVSGGCGVIVGLGLFIGGEIHDHSGNRRYSIISKGNQVGVAYNF